MKESAAIGPLGEPTPPSSTHPDNASPTSPIPYTAPDTPLTPLNEASNHGDVQKRVANEHGIKCMFQADCDTGSQLRKAISHIFGRNKMCTRLVPAQVWVHYCRKHYQRSRYRNPKEYAKLQCDLVQKQIRRIHDWSRQNQQNGLPGVVQDWGLAVRKREQKRIDELSGAKRKRSAAQYDDSEDGEDDSQPVPATAVPKWLRSLCGKGYDTISILNIFNRLHTEILADLMPQFPDIEILPNIATEAEESQQPKGYAKRAVTGAGHKRSQSLGVGAKSGLYSPNGGPTGHLPRWNSAGDIEVSPMQKRQRRSDMMEANPFGSRAQMSHRLVYTSIAENPIESGEMRQYGPSWLPQLAAPIPQRLGGQSMAESLESSSARRPGHHRSQSDYVGLSRARETYGGSSPYNSASAHPSSMGSYGSSRSHQEPPNSFAFNNAPQNHGQHFQSHQSPRGGMLSSKHLPRVGHARHQSMPMANFPTHPNMQRDFSHGLPPLSQYSSNDHTLPPVTHITESPQTPSLYREGR